MATDVNVKVAIMVKNVITDALEKVREFQVVLENFWVS